MSVTRGFAGMRETTQAKALEYKYKSQRPVWTLFYLLNKPFYFYIWLTLVYLLKQSPVYIIPFLLAEVINTLAAVKETPIQNMVGLFAFASVMVAQNIPSHCYFIHLLSSTVRRMEKGLRNDLAIRIQQLSISFHDRTESGRLQAKVLRDVEQIQNFCMFFGEVGLGSLCSLLFAIIVVSVRDPRLLPIFVFLVPVAATIRTLFRNGIQTRNRVFRSEVEAMSSEVIEMINMIPVTRAHGLEEEAKDKVLEKFDSVNESGKRLDMMNALFGSSAWVTFQLSLLIGLAVLSWSCWNGWITVGEIALYQSMFTMMVTSTTQLINLFPHISKGIESIYSIGDILECPDLEQNEGKHIVKSVQGEVLFDGVSFHYDNSLSNAVSDFSLHVKPGECVAFVGPSGAGKSTLMQLLIGFHRPQQGRILLDNRDMENIDMRHFRRSISVVPQETVLFSGTIRDNIVHGSKNGGAFDEGSLYRVLEMANLKEFIEQMPQGLDTKIGENGALLSGGQRQRLAIARALFRDPRILVLDEATSALDVIAEKQVQEAINRAIQNRTTFIVAHRLSTIRQANRIVVMKDGRCIECGTYEELAARDGVFSEMQALQVK